MKKNKLKRQKRIRAKIIKSDRLRLSVFRSNLYMYAQIIDDKIGKTLVSVSKEDLTSEIKNKIEMAKALGLALAKKAKDKKIEEVVFDKGAYRYHGRVKALSEGAREGGLKF